jgi:hypothetical protein
MKYTSIDCFINGLSAKVPQKRFVNAASEEEKEAFKKGYRKSSYKSQKDSQ